MIRLRTLAAKDSSLSFSNSKRIPSLQQLGIEVSVKNNMEFVPKQVYLNSLTLSMQGTQKLQNLSQRKVVLVRAESAGNARQRKTTEPVSSCGEIENFSLCLYNTPEGAPVAQLDRALDFGSRGWGFKSLQARQGFQDFERLLSLENLLHCSDAEKNQFEAPDSEVENLSFPGIPGGPHIPCTLKGRRGFVYSGSPGQAPVMPSVAHSIVMSSSMVRRTPSGTRRFPLRS